MRGRRKFLEPIQWTMGPVLLDLMIWVSTDATLSELNLNVGGQIRESPENLVAVSTCFAPSHIPQMIS